MTLDEIDDETAIGGAANALILARATLVQALRQAGHTEAEADRYIAEHEHQLQERAARARAGHA